MSWIENLLIVAGISLDLFGAMICQGSLVSKVNKKHLSLICLIIGLWQLAALFLGHFVSNILLQKGDIPDEFLAGEIVAILIFLGLCVRLIVKGVRNEFFQEHLERTLGYKRFIKMTAATSVYTLLAGVAFGFFGTNILMILIMIFCISVIVVIGGMYVGYHFGFEGKEKGYIIGAVLLGGAGIDLIIRTIITYC